ncbi:glycerate kinase [candidate division WOR-3 bacterium]|nr:glycerate kinase [candidate division WOR-3 bacterium]
MNSRIIKNYKELIKDGSQTRKDVLNILEYILAHIKPEEAVKQVISQKDNFLLIDDIKIPFDKIKNIYVIGGGKASFQMAESLYSILKERISEGVISVKEAPMRKIGPIKIKKGGHPIPDQNSLEASREIIRLIKKADENDIILALISGGGSALLCYPLENISLSDLQKTTKLLLSSGATINEINTVRKHLSRIKGGRLSEDAYPAQIISLIISDVVGDELTSIASGPTSPDDSTFSDAHSILVRYRIDNKIPPSVSETLRRGMKGEIPETPFQGNPTFKRTHNIIILNNLSALKAGKTIADKMGYNTLIISSLLEGESRDTGILHAGIAGEIESSSNPLPPPAIILSGGETTVTLKEYNSKRGGPNQECVLGFAERLHHNSKAVFISVDSDGIDGNSRFAGGIIGGNAQSLNEKDLIKALKNHQSTVFLEKIGGCILTGETGTNVNDIRILGIEQYIRFSDTDFH